VLTSDQKGSIANGLRRRPDTPDEIDAFAAYCSETDSCYFLPINAFPRHRSVQLRLRATRNNQQLGINWARDFEFMARLRASGAVAQLGERLAGSQKVTGSSPVGSTLG
jgi:hypothetical protein